MASAPVLHAVCCMLRVKCSVELLALECPSSLVPYFILRAAQNPFEHMHRDSDVEGMSDGFDPMTAYGAHQLLPALRLIPYLCTVNTSGLHIGVSVQCFMHLPNRV